MGDTATDEDHPLDYHVAADNAAGNRRQQSSGQGISHEFVLKRFYHGLVLLQYPMGNTVGYHLHRAPVGCLQLLGG
ncbi:MAG: hypothetical protein DDT24_00529 [Chloroflexi bacterium]|nr:hypothetical protein [Chloroflexota bacterium]